jgi:hypothetical protein
MRRAGAAGVLILTLLSGCDNVNWGGADLTIVRPPPKIRGAQPVATGPEPGVERLPEGPILYYVTVDERGGTLQPVAEISGDSLRAIRPGENPRAFADAFIASHMRQGAEFVLFHSGARAGTLIVQSADLNATLCPALPRALGTLELGSSTVQLSEFLALARVQAPQVARRNDEGLETTRTMQVLAPILAEKILRVRQAPLPANWQRAMAQLKPFPLANSTNPGFATTFLIGDTLGPGLDNDGVSLLYVGVPEQLNFDTAYIQFHNYAQDGKRAPRVIDYLDWNRDDEVELLLRVYGVNDTWLEAVGRGKDGRWRRLFSGQCETPTPAGTDTSVIPPTLTTGVS